MSSFLLDEVLSLLNFLDVALSGSCRRVSESVLLERDRLEKFNLICVIFFLPSRQWYFLFFGFVVDPSVESRNLVFAVESLRSSIFSVKLSR